MNLLYCCLQAIFILFSYKVKEINNQIYYIFFFITIFQKHQNSNSKSNHFLRRRHFFENHKNELKIEEENVGSLKELSSTLQIGKNGVWNSDDSILRSRDNVDEDNKSSSSCEDGSAVLSSGKSGNSLDSSELDHEMTESGIGTASPPKDQVI